jgi:hypothetical protein
MQHVQTLLNVRALSIIRGTHPKALKAFNGTAVRFNRSPIDGRGPNTRATYSAIVRI